MVTCSGAGVASWMNGRTHARYSNHIVRKQFFNHTKNMCFSGRKLLFNLDAKNMDKFKNIRDTNRIFLNEFFQILPYRILRESAEIRLLKRSFTALVDQPTDSIELLSCLFVCVASAYLGSHGIIESYRSLSSAAPFKYLTPRYYIAEEYCFALPELIIRIYIIQLVLLRVICRRCIIWRTTVYTSCVVINLICHSFNLGYNVIYQ